MNNILLLLSKNDIPFPEAQLTIHQPTISDISFIGEENFFIGCEFLNFSKYKILSEQDKNSLDQYSDFDIFMSVMCSKEETKYKEAARLVLTLIFPDYDIQFKNNEIFLVKDKEFARINNTNFNIFKNILVDMFDLGDQAHSADYNPVDSRAAKIAEKLKKGKQKAHPESKEKTNRINILGRFISILAIGCGRSINDYMQYTVFQLKDEFNRFQKKMAYDIYIQAKMAGAKDLDNVDNWMEDIHP